VPNVIRFSPEPRNLLTPPDVLSASVSVTLKKTLKAFIPPADETRFAGVFYINFS
jgi:hypothetical protein